MRSKPGPKGLMVGLDGVNVVTKTLASGKRVTYYYAWRGKGAPRLDTNDLAGSYARAMEKAPDRSFSGAIDDFQKSLENRSRSDLWRREMEAFHEIIRASFGTAEPRFFCKPEMRSRVKRFRDKHAARSAKQADKMVGELIAICNWLVDEGRITPHAIGGISKVYKPPDRSDILIEPGERAAWVRSASEFAAPFIDFAPECGLDLSDLANLQWKMINFQTGVISARRGKTAIKARPVLTMRAREILGSLERKGAHVFTSSKNQPWRVEGIKSAIQRAKAKAIEVAPTLREKHFKDFRGTACTNYHTLGYSHADIAVFLGWSEKQVEGRLRDYLSRDVAAGAAVLRLADQNQKGT